MPPTFKWIVKDHSVWTARPCTINIASSGFANMQQPIKPNVPGERQGPIHTAIVNELIALTPDWWNAVTLTVEVATQEGIQSMPHEIRSPEGHREPIALSDQLFDLTRQLFRLFQEYIQPWKQVVYEVSLDPKGDWKWECAFTYL
jgi:hypothetical protein